jgi:HK97 family phage prohead protease
VRRFLSVDQYTALPKSERDSDIAITAESNEAPVPDGDRRVRYVFSTPEIGRDMHTVASDAWVMDNFLRNPTFLWAHDDRMLPIGRVVEIGDVNGKLKGTVEYAERDLNPFADAVYQHVRAGYLSAVSTAWIPIEGTMSRDKSRLRGVDFTKVELLEISQVPVPGLPAALAEARSAGLDVMPFGQWAEQCLDNGRFEAVPRVRLERIARAAGRPARTYIGAGGATAGAARVARARQLAAENTDLSFLARYRRLRYDRGYTMEQVAAAFGTSARNLRITIARILAREGR